MFFRYYLKTCNNVALKLSELLRAIAKLILLQTIAVIGGIILYIYMAFKQSGILRPIQNAADWIKDVMLAILSDEVAVFVHDTNLEGRIVMTLFVGIVLIFVSVMTQLVLWIIHTCRAKLHRWWFKEDM